MTDNELKVILEALRFWLIDEFRGKLVDVTERIPDKNAMDIVMDKKTLQAHYDRKATIENLLSRLKGKHG